MHMTMKLIAALKHQRVMRLGFASLRDPRSAGSSRAQLEAQARRIAHASYNATQRSAREGLICSASPHCCERTPGEDHEEAGRFGETSAVTSDLSDDFETASPGPTDCPTPSSTLSNPRPPEDDFDRPPTLEALRLSLPSPTPPAVAEAGLAEPSKRLQCSARELIRSCPQVGCILQAD